MHRPLANFPKVDAGMTGSDRNPVTQTRNIRPGIHNVDQCEVRPVSTLDPGLKRDRTRRGVVDVKETTTPPTTSQ